MIVSWCNDSSVCALDRNICCNRASRPYVLYVMMFCFLFQLLFLSPLFSISHTSAYVYLPHFPLVRFLSLFPSLLLVVPESMIFLHSV